MRETDEVLRDLGACYDAMSEDLEARAFGKWAVLSEGRLVGVYDSNREASEVVLSLVPGQVCLVRRIGHVVDLSRLMMRINPATLPRG